MKTVLLAAIFFSLSIVTTVISHSDVFLRTDVITDLVSYLQWTDAVFVYDRTLASKCRQRLLTDFARLNVGITTVELTSSQNDVIGYVTSAIESTTILFILVCLEPTKTALFLQQAKRSNMLNQQYYWLIICTGMKMEDLNGILDRNRSNVVLIIPDMTSPDYVSDDAHPVNSSCLDGNVTEMNIKSSTPHESTTKVGNSFSFTIHSYDFKTTSFNHVAFWTTSSRLTVVNGIIYPGHFHQFNGATLKVGAAPIEPFTEILPGNGNVEYEGFCIDILDEMAQRLNFNYEIVNLINATYGSSVNGTWNGIMRMLMERKLDMAVGPVSITPEREEVVDFTVPFMEGGGVIITKGGDPGSDMMKVFRPFSLLLWLSLAASIIVASVVLFFINKFKDWPCIRNTFGQQQQQQPQHQQQQRTEQWTPGACLLVIFGSLMKQSVSCFPESSSGRLVLGCWWIFAILVTSIYTASLAAILTVNVKVDTIDSIQELAASSLDPVTVVDTNWWAMFKESHTGAYGTINARMAKGPVIRNSMDALKLVREGTAAFITDIKEASYIYGQDCHNLYLSENVFSNNGLGFALPKHAYYRGAMNDVILRLQQGGILEAWKRKWWQTSPECKGKDATLNDKQMQLLSIGGIFIAYVIIAALSLVCFLLPWVRKSAIQHWMRQKGQSSGPPSSGVSDYGRGCDRC